MPVSGVLALSISVRPLANPSLCSRLSPFSLSKKRSNRNANNEVLQAGENVWCLTFASPLVGPA